MLNADASLTLSQVVVINNHANADAQGTGGAGGVASGGGIDNDTADDCLQIHGGAGYMVEYDIERAARDARLGPIGGGTDEIMREILGKSLGL